MSCYDSFCKCIYFVCFPIIWLWNKLCQFVDWLDSKCCQQSNLDNSQNISVSNYQNHGLPNIGNTCYLNSVLQIIFAAEQLRQSIINAAKRQRLVFHSLIANVFEDITKRGDNRMKRKHLQEIISYLTVQNPQILKYRQNDAYQCLLAVLNILENEDPRNSKLNFFKVKYESKCNCSNEGAYFQECFIVMDQVCIMCKKEFTFKVMNSSPYLIILPKKSFQLKVQLKQDKYKFNNKVYQIKGFITYFGDKKSGHYISKRREKEVWLQINDGTVQNVGKICSTKTIPAIALYQRQ